MVFVPSKRPKRERQRTAGPKSQKEAEESLDDLARRLLAEQQAAEESPSMRLYDSLPGTPENILRIAAAMLEDPLVGDVSPSTMHGFAMWLSREDAALVLPEIERMRRAHFRRLGKPLPKYNVRLR